MWEKRPSVKGGKGRYVFTRTNHIAQPPQTGNNASEPLSSDPCCSIPTFLGCVVANQQAFGNRNELLNLDSTEVTDAGLVHVEGLSRLESLDLANTKVTGTGLVHLEG